MKILITAGGTSEKIDEVRKITNTASGRLGALIAGEFISREKAEIVYVCGEDSVTPTGEDIEIIRISSADELKGKITYLLQRDKFDAVIHSMAVSDYTVRSVIQAEDLAASVANAVFQNENLFNDYDGLVNTVSSVISQMSDSFTASKKISSDFDNPILLMKKTVKVISLIKQLQPETILVGFKLLVDVNEETLSRVGHDLLVRNDCDFVLANDLKHITDEAHVGILIKPDSSYVPLSSKQKIAEAITENVISKLRGAV